MMFIAENNNHCYHKPLTLVRSGNRKLPVNPMVYMSSSDDDHPPPHIKKSVCRERERDLVTYNVDIYF